MRVLAIYFVLVFALAWGAVLLVVGPSDITEGATPESRQLLPVFGAMLLGPALAGGALLALTGGRRGLYALWKRQTHWRVAPRWYAIGMLATPALVLGILIPLSIISPVFIPRVAATVDVAGIVVFALVSGLIAGLFEEIGWTGFATPRLLRRFSIVAAGSIVGVLWGVWHALADYWGTHVEFGALWLPRIVLWTLALTAFRILMTWIYANTGSLLLAQLMHASFTGSQGLLVPQLAPPHHMLWYGTFTLALWALVAALARHLRQQAGA